METEDVFNGLGIEVRLEEEDDFLMVKETLTRMGVSSRKENKLFQSCHILHKRGRYAIMHFKELFILDGLESDISESDIARRNLIAKLIDEWELCEILDKEKILEKVCKEFNVKASNIVYIGDDVNDMPLLKNVGISVSPGDAWKNTKQIVDYVTEKHGGKGVLREISDLILDSNNKL